MESISQQQIKPQSTQDTVVIVLALLVVLPFLVGALLLGWQVFKLPENAPDRLQAQLFTATLFSFGFAMGLWGTIHAFGRTMRSRRMMGASAVLGGCGYIVAAFTIGDAIKYSAYRFGESPVHALFVPALCWIFTIALSIWGAKIRKREEQEKKAAMEEPLQPLSQP